MPPDRSGAGRRSGHGNVLKVHGVWRVQDVVVRAGYKSCVAQRGKRRDDIEVCSPETQPTAGKTALTCPKYIAGHITINVPPSSM